MTKPFRILIAVDESEASERALAYAGELLRGRSDARICPLHVLGPFPAELRAAAGEAVTDELRNGQAAWMDEARSDAKPLLEKAKRALENAGVDASAIDPHLAEAATTDDVAETIIEAARELACGTVVLGRESISWAPQLFYRHVGEQVVRGADHLAVWIVG